MNSHVSDALIELFSMGKLQEPDLAAVEEHLLQCDECQETLLRMDLFLGCIRAAVPPTIKCEYLLVQAALPNTTQDIGVILLDAHSDRLYSRFRRDFKEFAGDEANWFKQLPDAISAKACQLGARKCLEWMESTFPRAVLSFTRMSVDVEDYATAVVELYAKHIRPNVLPFRTHLPQYSLEASAGSFGKQMTAIEPEGWVEVCTDIPLTDDMFVTHVQGHSMEPEIPDPSLCAFRSKIDGSWDGKIMLIEQYGESDGSRYTVKLIRISKNVDPTAVTDEAWLHERVSLESINPDYESWDVASARKITLLGEFLFVV